MSSVSSAAVATLRALARPARLDLLDGLRVHEKLTAGRVRPAAREFQQVVLVSPGPSSRPGPRGPGRRAHTARGERPWRRVADEIETGIAETGAEPRARAEAARVIAQRELDLLTVFLGQEPGEPAKWRAAFTLHTRAAVMSAGQLRERGLAVEALITEHGRRARQSPATVARPVRLTAQGFPQVIPCRTAGRG